MVETTYGKVKLRYYKCPNGCDEWAVVVRIEDNKEVIDELDLICPVCKAMGEDIIP